MGDPLSVAASVVGILSLGLQSTEYLYKFYTACRDREKDLATVVKQLDQLLRTLQNIEQVVCTRRWRSGEAAIIQSIEESITRCQDTVQDLQAHVARIQKEPTDTWKDKLVKAGRQAAYPFKRSTLAKIEEDVQDFRDHLSITLQVLELKEHQNTQDDIQEINAIVTSTYNDVAVVTALVQNIQAHNVSADLRRWLKAPDATVDFNAACGKRHTGTGQWLVQGTAFTRWLSQDNGFLWLYGFAGSGKSVLCSAAIEHTFRQQRTQPGQAIAFFFFTFRDEAKQDTSAMLRALLLQLAGQISSLESELVRLQKSYEHGIPPVPVLIECLRHAIERSQRVYILLDALDECPTENVSGGQARREVLTTVERIRKWQLPALHLLVTSRDLDAPEIRDSIQSIMVDDPASHIPLKNDDIQQDIANYVSHQVEHDSRLRRWSEQQRETIKEHLTRRADGVFRWVDCQLQPLRQCARSERKLRQCLSTLPDTLDETYERMLCNIDSSSREEAQQILALLCFSRRPLLVEEVIEAVAVDLIDQERYDQDRRFDSENDLLQVCAGLIDTGVIGPREDNIIRLGEVVGEVGKARYFALSSPSQHGQLSKACLLYLQNPELTRRPFHPDLVQRYILLQYAARYWFEHYLQADVELQRRLSKHAVTLLTIPALLELWLRLYRPLQPWWPEVTYDEIDDIETPIFYSALLGLDDILASILLQHSSEINAPADRFITAIEAASEKGHLSTVQLLLDRGAEVNATKEGSHNGALANASFHGHLAVVQLLLDRGAKINASHLAMVQLLLDQDAEANIVGGRFGTALQVKSHAGFFDVVKLLLDRGAEVNVVGGRFGTELQVASEGDFREVEQLMLRRERIIKEYNDRVYAEEEETKRKEAKKMHF